MIDSSRCRFAGLCVYSSVCFANDDDDDHVVIQFSKTLHSACIFGGAQSIPVGALGKFHKISTPLPKAIW